jgi:hypothetical protein
VVQSTILVAVRTDKRPEMTSDDPVFANYLKHDVTGLVGKSCPVLTDEFAPVDYYTNKAIR